MSSILFFICAALGAGILVVHAVVLVGISLARKNDRCCDTDPAHAVSTVDISAAPPPVTVTLVVPARNEELLLPRLLRSLAASDLTGVDDFELVVVNDRSTDRTEAIVAEFARSAPWPVRIVQVPDEPVPGARANPKQHALHHGTVDASKELFLFTDADCVVGPQWVRRMVLPFRDPKLGLLFGTVMPQGGGRFTRQYQSFDHLFRYYYTAGSAGFGNPTGGFGNNIAVRRSALESVGGFASLRYSVTEDAELIAEVRDTGRWEVSTTLSPQSIVWPEPQTTIASMVSQSMRWNTGGLYAPDRASRYSYRTVMLFLFGSVAAAPLAILFPPLLLTTAGSFISMLSVAIAAAWISRRPARFWVMLLPNVLFSMVFYSYITLLTLLRTPIRWKDRLLGEQRSG
ncbi:glycosyltransferase [Salinispira pacifica]